MSPSTQDPRPPDRKPGLRGSPRRPFAGSPRPTPFHQTREFQVFGVLVLLVLGVLMVAVFMLRTRNTSTTGAGADGATAETSPHRVLTDEERATRDARLHSMFEGSLADTSNGEAFAQTEGYHRLLEILKSYPPEEFDKLPRKKLDWAAAMADPGAWRGEIVWMRGVLAERYAVRLDHPVFDTPDVVQGILLEGDGTNGVVFDMIDETPDMSYRTDAVDVVGIFYRTVRYPTAKPDPDAPKVDGKRQLPPYRFETPEGEVQEAPHLLVKSVTPVVKPKRDPTGILKIPRAAAFAGLGLAFAATCLITYSIQRRTRRYRGTPRARLDAPGGSFEKRWNQPNRTSGPPTEV